MVEKKRLYNLDLLRIIAMLMIVTIHFIGKGGVLAAFPPTSLQYNLTLFIESLCNIGVNCFILISGYFLINSKFKISKLLLLEAEIIFYTTFIYLTFILTGKTSFSFFGLVSSLLPTLSGEYWFVSAYIGMYILSPFLNKMISNLDRIAHKKLIIVLICMFSLWPVVFFFGNTFSLQGYYLNTGFSVVWFVVLYIISSYIRLYYNPTLKTKTYLMKYACTAIICASIALFTSYLFNQYHNTAFSNLKYLLNGYNSITMLLPSIAIFLLFLNLRIKDDIVNKMIAFFTPLTFAVYLIHDDPYIGAILWKHIPIAQYIQGSHFIIFTSLCIIAIYVSCSLVDFVRLFVFNSIGRLNWFRRIYVATQAFAMDWIKKIEVKLIND